MNLINLFELPYFDQSVKVFRTGPNQFDTLTKHTLIGKTSLNPILDGGGGQICPPPAGFLNIAQKPLGLGS